MRLDKFLASALIFVFTVGDLPLAFSQDPVQEPAQEPAATPITTPIPEAKKEEAPKPAEVEKPKTPTELELFIDDQHCKEIISTEDPQINDEYLLCAVRAYLKNYLNTQQAKQTRSEKGEALQKSLETMQLDLRQMREAPDDIKTPLIQKIRSTYEQMVQLQQEEESDEMVEENYKITANSLAEMIVEETDNRKFNKVVLGISNAYEQFPEVREPLYEMFQPLKDLVADYLHKNPEGFERNLVGSYARWAIGLATAFFMVAQGSKTFIQRLGPKVREQMLAEELFLSQRATLGPNASIAERMALKAPKRVGFVSRFFVNWASKTESPVFSGIRALVNSPLAGETVDVVAVETFKRKFYQRWVTDPMRSLWLKAQLGPEGWKEMLVTIGKSSKSQLSVFAKNTVRSPYLWAFAGGAAVGAGVATFKMVTDGAKLDPMKELRFKHGQIIGNLTAEMDDLKVKVSTATTGLDEKLTANSKTLLEMTELSETQREKFKTESLPGIKKETAEKSEELKKLSEEFRKLLAQLPHLEKTAAFFKGDIPIEHAVKDPKNVHWEEIPGISLDTFKTMCNEMITTFSDLLPRLETVNHLADAVSSIAPTPPPAPPAPETPPTENK